MTDKPAGLDSNSKGARPESLALNRTVASGTVRQNFSRGRSKPVEVERRKKRVFKKGAGGRMEEDKATRATSGLTETPGLTLPAGGNAAAPPVPPQRRAPSGLSEGERRARRVALEERARRLAESVPPMGDHVTIMPSPEQELETLPPPQARRRPPHEPPPPPPPPPPSSAIDAGPPPMEEGDPGVTVDPSSASAPDVRVVARAPRPSGRGAPHSDAPARGPRPPRDRAEGRAPGLGAAGPRPSGPRAGEPRAGGTGSLGARSAGPRPSGPRPVGQHPAGSRAAGPRSVPAAPQPPEATERTRKPRSRPRREVRKPASRAEQPARRRTGKITVQQALDDTERQRSLASVRRARERERAAQRRAQASTAQKMVREVVVPEAITVQELANRMAIRSAEVVKTLMGLGVMATVTQTIDADTAELVVGELGHRVKRVSAADVEIGLKADPDGAEDLQTRSPVVTVMGHVDHGKTSILDALRSTDVAAKEAGGITQHVGAYQVTTESGQKITFIDTPGHAAFTAMRARGADVTDIVVLVVAADDGVMAQTVEAAQHARAAGKTIVLAINKIDMPGADPTRVKQQLLQHEIVTEDHGGDVIPVEVSATKKINLDGLINAILLQAEIADLQANPARSAEGVVIESRLDRGRGVVATLLIQRGTLRVGDIVVAGSKWGRVRALSDERGQKVAEAAPSVPVEMLGLSEVPEAGDEFVVVRSDARAREVGEYRARMEKQKRVAALVKGTSVEEMLKSMGEAQQQTIAVIIKADAHGSLQAIAQALAGLATEEVSCQVLFQGVGAITESDVTLAAATPALVIGFNVRADAVSRQLARRQGVDIRYFGLIHELIDDVRSMLSDLLAPEIREDFLGYARIKEVFQVSKIGNVAGCEVTEGVVRRGARVRLLRDNVVIHTGTLATLKRFKDDVDEVRAGTECGMSFVNYEDIRANDVIECFTAHEERRTLGG